jgi:glycerophosphoryl diester phosphodiesterase
VKKIVLLLASALFVFTACTEQTAQVKILAHRGNASTGSQFTTDENTLDALARAQELGFAGVEFDVHLTADNQLVIRHDNKITDELSCQESSFDEIRAYVLPFGHQIPTLREWLVQAKKTPHIKQLLEIKSHKGDREKELIAMSLEIIRELDMLDQMYMLSFDTEVIDEVLRQEPNMKVVLNSSNLHHSLTPEEVKSRGYHAVSYNINVILNHTDWIEQFRNYGIETFLWMVNTPYTYNIAKDLGFTWVTTDFYDAITAE